MNQAQVDKLTEQVLEIYDEAVKELGLEDSDLILDVVHNTRDRAGGAYINIIKMVSINLAQIRTLRDMIYIVAHELRHAYQHKALGDDKFLDFAALNVKAANSGDYYAYFFSPLEVDANYWAMRYEGKMKYKNRILNRSVEGSFFVKMKEHMSNPDVRVQRVQSFYNAKAQLRLEERYEST